MRQWRGVLGAVMAAAILGIAVPRHAEAKIWAQWVQLGPDGSSSVRVITDEACPSVVFDGTAVPMGVRSEPGQKFDGVKPAEFTVRGCEVAVPAGAVTAEIAGKPLPLPRPNPRRIVMFGDTGCRLLRPDPTQACNDPLAWPFQKVAALAAATYPDLVIHVGDYEYREEACPVGNTGCAGSPYGYGWAPWYADFFEPAAPLFAAAPWVMVRGNHEDCSRAGEGWFRFLDRLPMEQACRDLTGAFVVRLGDFGLVVFDSGKAADPKDDSGELAATLRKQFDAVLDRIPEYAWFTTHRPFNGVLATPGGAATNLVSNKVLQQGIGPDLPASVRMIASGHIHLFQAVDFGGARPPQLVVGTGGDNLDKGPPQSLEGSDINGRKVISAATYPRFGYMVWDRLDATTWSGTLFDIEGKPIDRCRLSDRLLNCGS